MDTLRIPERFHRPSFSGNRKKPRSRLERLLLVVFLLSIFGTLPWASRAHAQSVSRFINYQGLIRDVDGFPLNDGPHDLTFKIYDAATGGTVLWSEVHP
ncbi:MAG: hypothetical protein D6795_15665, partial [Deltaproteobacteria bacterium]